MERKLKLSKETLRTLDDNQLDAVVGGAASNGLVCVDSAVCHSGACNSVACDSVICRSAICNSGAVCNSVIC